MWGFKPPVATPLSLTTSENFMFEPTAVMHSDVSMAFSLVVVTKTITPVLVGFSNRPLSKNHWKTLSVQFTRQERYFIRPCGWIATYMWISSAYSWSLTPWCHSLAQHTTRRATGLALSPVVLKKYSKQYPICRCWQPQWNRSDRNDLTKDIDRYTIQPKHTLRPLT